MKTFILLLITAFAFTGCSSHSIHPDKENVKMSRDAADEDCKSLGKVAGTTMSPKGTSKEALANMEQEAANKGANYVVVGQYSATGTAVTGQAYLCP